MHFNRTQTHINKHALSLIQFTRFQLSYYKISDKVSFITRTLQQHSKTHTHTTANQATALGER